LHWCEPVWCNQHGALLGLNAHPASRDLRPMRGTCSDYGTDLCKQVLAHTAKKPVIWQSATYLPQTLVASGMPV